MVYTQLMILVGTILTRKQVEEILKNKNVDLDEDDDIVEIFNNMLKEPTSNAARQVQLFSFPCCFASDVFILGSKVHSYYRKYVNCRDCKEYACCDMCIGETTGGYYNVVEIAENPIEIAKEKICICCNSDQFSKGKCRLCFNKNVQKKWTAPWYFEKVFKMLKIKNGEIGYYYMLNDCLSCT